VRHPGYALSANKKAALRAASLQWRFWPYQ
jgi:hypothetical protein